LSFVHRYCIRHPCQALIGAVVALAVCVPGLGRLRLRTDGHALVPAEAPAVQLDDRLREEFGLKDTIVVVVRAPPGVDVFNAGTVALVNELSGRLSRIAGLAPSDIFSLATERGRRVRPGTLQFLKFLDPLPVTPAELATLREDVGLIGVYDGTLIAADKRATAIFVSVPGKLDRTWLYSQVQAAIDSLPSHAEEIEVTGAPIAESLLGTHILEDLGIPTRWFGAVSPERRPDESSLPRSLDELREFIARHIGVLPIALAVMTMIFLASFRSLAAVALTLLKIGSILVMVFGLMGWFSVPIYLTIAVMPIILTATGTSDEVHIFDLYARQLAASASSALGATPEAGPALVTTMDELHRPIVLTSLTTAAAFLSFALSPLAPVRAFGIFTAVGCLLCICWALTATPATIRLVPAKWFQPKEHRRRHEPGAQAAGTTAAPADPRPVSFAATSDPSPTCFTRLGDSVVRHRRMILLASALFVGISWLGIRRIRVQDSWIDGFSPASSFHRATTAFNEQFLGMHLLFVCVDTGGRTLEGRITGADVDYFSVKIPAAGIADPAGLVGRSIELRLIPPDSQPAAPLHPSMIHRTEIESAMRSGDQIVVGLVRNRGSPRYSLRLTNHEPVVYEITPQHLKRPEHLARIKALEEFIASRREDRVGGVLGPARYVETTNFIGMGCKEEHRRIPDRERLEWVWNWYANIRGPERTRATVDAAYSRGIISVFLKNANFIDTARLLGALREYERTHLAPHGTSLSFAGDVAVSQTLIDAIVTTQIRSLALSLVGVLLVTVLVSRSIGWGVACVLPCAVAIPVNFALMGALGIPLGVATSMFASMSVGIGVDYAIHFVERYRLEMRKPRSETGSIAGSQGRDLTLRETFRLAGPANLIDALGVALGFGILTLSQVPANARLGLMVVTSILTCLAATLLVLPALLAMFPGRRTGRSNE